MSDDKLTETITAVRRVQNFDPSTLARREELGNALSFEAAAEPAGKIIRRTVVFDATSALHADRRLAASA